jgi:hypothetical protein
MKVEFSGQIFEKYVNVKIHKNSFGGCRIVPCRRTDRQTDMRKPIVVFRNFPTRLDMYSVPISLQKLAQYLKPTGMASYSSHYLYLCVERSPFLDSEPPKQDVTLESTFFHAVRAAPDLQCMKSCSAQ